MNRLLAVCLLISSSVAAADYYGGRIDTYDPVTGLYHKAVSEKAHGGLLSSKTASGPINVAITNPANSLTVLLFKEPVHGSVTSVLFETGFKDGSVEFSGNTDAYVLNNKAVPKREPKNRLLVVVSNRDDEQSELYTADKSGGNLKKVVAVPRGDDWHIDVKNSMIRVVHQIGSGIKLESFEW
jgi:hypothetical protein